MHKQIFGNINNNKLKIIGIAIISILEIENIIYQLLIFIYIIYYSSKMKKSCVKFNGLFLCVYKIYFHVRK